MRLDRWLTDLGLASRKESQQLIRSGAVLVHGIRLTSPEAAVNPEEGGLTVRGEVVDGRLSRHIMLHKPAGLLTAARDARQPTVMSLLPPVCASIGCMPVGRLDKDTTGLLLLTTDGEMNHRLLSPGRHVWKRYRAVVDGPLGSAESSAFGKGLTLSDFTALPAELVILRSSPDEAEALVTIREGKYHQVRRMFAAVGRTVLTLQRESFGPLELDPVLQPGEWRELTPAELSMLRQAAGMEAKA